MRTYRIFAVIEFHSEHSVPKLTCPACTDNDNLASIYWIRGYQKHERHRDLPDDLFRGVADMANDPSIQLPEAVLVGEQCDGVWCQELTWIVSLRPDY